jgi:hypothetical protein
MEDLTSFENRVCSSEHIFACWVVVARKKKSKFENYKGWEKFDKNIYLEVGTGWLKKNE